MERLPVVAAELDRGDADDAARHADDRAGVGQRRRGRGGRRSRWSSTRPMALVSSSGSGGSWRSCGLGEPDAADRQRHGGLGVVDADRELGRAAADVEDEERSSLGFELGGGAEEAEQGLLLPVEHLEVGAEHLAGLGQEVVAVGDVAQHRRGHRPDARPPRGRRAPCRSSARQARVRATASGWRRPVAATPWPSRVVITRRSSSLVPSVTSSRTELVPMSMAATFTAARRRGPRAPAGGPPTGRPGRRHRPGARRSGRGGT